MAMDFRQSLAGFASFLVREGVKYAVQNGMKPRGAPAPAAKPPPRQYPSTSPIHSIGCPYGYAAAHLKLAEHHLELAQRHPDAATLHHEMAVAYIYEAPARLPALGGDGTEAVDLELDLIELHKSALSAPRAAHLLAEVQALTERCASLCHSHTIGQAHKAAEDDPIDIIRGVRRGDLTRRQAVERLKVLLEEEDVVEGQSRRVE